MVYKELDGARKKSNCNHKIKDSADIFHYRRWKRSIMGHVYVYHFCLMFLIFSFFYFISIFFLLACSNTCIQICVTSKEVVIIWTSWHLHINEKHFCWVFDHDSMILTRTCSTGAPLMQPETTKFQLKPHN